MVDSGNGGEEDEEKDEQEQRTGTVIPDEIKATIIDHELVNGMMMISVVSIVMT